jgi:hypothetical protein
VLVLFLSFAEGIYLGFEVFQVPLFALPESALGSSVLSLAFLFVLISVKALEQRTIMDLQW